MEAETFGDCSAGGEEEFDLVLLLDSDGHWGQALQGE